MWKTGLQIYRILEFDCVLADKTYAEYSKKVSHRVIMVKIKKITKKVKTCPRWNHLLLPMRR